MNDDRFNALLNRCESPIERELLTQLYPALPASRARELRAQYAVDRYTDLSVTRLDFAFPDMQIAIYCDGFAPRDGSRSLFVKDRFQSRELQLRGWIVLRFAGAEINRDGEMVVETIQRAIARRNRQRDWRRQQEEREQQTFSTPERSTTREPRQGSPNTQRPPRQQPWSGDQSAQRPPGQQRPEGGWCGVIFASFVVVGILILLDFLL